MPRICGGSYYIAVNWWNIDDKQGVSEAANVVPVDEFNKGERVLTIAANEDAVNPQSEKSCSTTSPRTIACT